MKEKQECKICKRDMTPNLCETHKNAKEKCYYCHLLKEHVDEFKPEKDKTPTAPKKDKPIKEDKLTKMKDKVNDAVDKSKSKTDRPELESESPKDSKNEYGFSRHDKDDRGLYS